MKDIVEQLDEIEVKPKKGFGRRASKASEEAVGSPASKALAPFESDEGGGGSPMDMSEGMDMSMEMPGGDEAAEFESLVAEFDDGKKRRLCEWLEGQMMEEPAQPAGLGSAVNDEGEMD